MCSRSVSFLPLRVKTIATGNSTENFLDYNNYYMYSRELNPREANDRSITLNSNEWLVRFVSTGIYPAKGDNQMINLLIFVF